MKVSDRCPQYQKLYARKRRELLSVGGVQINNEGMQVYILADEMAQLQTNEFFMKKKIRKLERAIIAISRNTQFKGEF